jgi:hypothetical protein
MADADFRTVTNRMLAARTARLYAWTRLKKLIQILTN